MIFSRYSEYKDSGIPWLVSVPSSWNTGALRWLSQRYSGGTPDKTKIEYWEDGTIPWLNSGSVNDKLIQTPSAYITESAFNTSSAKWIPKNSLVIALAGQGKTKGMVAQLGIDSTSNQSMAAIIPKDIFFYRYLYWWLDSNYENIRNMAGGDLRDGLNLEMLGDIQCPIPSRTEQIKISKFLDHETSKIDTLVIEQENLIELLKEKRQVVISNAVSKGLNPDVRLKHSGVVWLDEVPEHWEIRRLKVLADIQTGDKDTENATENGEYPFFVRSQTIERIGTYTFDCEAILTAGDGVGVGKVFHYYNGPFDFHQRVYMLNNFKDVSGRYLFNFFKENFFKVALEGGAKSTVDSLRRPMLTNFPVCIPPEIEQEEIVKFCELQSAKFDQLIEESKKNILLLQERRSALISAAVTGQIDVRNFHAI